MRGRYGGKLAVDPTLVYVDRRNASRLTDVTLGQLDHALLLAKVQPVSEAQDFAARQRCVMYRLSDVLRAVRGGENA